MKFSQLPTVLLVACFALSLFVALPSARADDVTMKSGKVYKNLTLLKETKKSYIFLNAKGRRVSLSKSAVEKIDKKPTVRGTFLEKKKAANLKQVDEVFTLAGWAQENGLKGEAKKLYKKCIKLDREHAGAREALGDKMLEGKWVSKSEYNRKMAKVLEKKYKAMGWKKHKGEWMSPVAIARAERGLVEHGDGHWVTVEDKKKIEEQNLSYVEGEWVDPETKKKMADGYRHFKGRWMLVDELNETHAMMSDPWVFKGRGVEVWTNARHRDATRAFKLAEDAYRGLITVFGDVHQDLYGKRDRLLLLVGKGIKSYQQFGGTMTREDRIALKSSAYGAFYAPQHENGRGAGATYAYSDDTWTRQWIANALTHAYVDRHVKNYANTDEKMLEAIAGWVQGTHKGKYQPSRWHLMRFFRNPGKFKFGTGTSSLERATYRTEQSIPHAGLFLEYLRVQNPEAWNDFWRQWLSTGNGSAQSLIAACVGEAGKFDENTVNKHYEEWRKKYLKTYKPWDV